MKPQINSKIIQGAVLFLAAFLVLNCESSEYVAYQIEKDESKEEPNPDDLNFADDKIGDVSFLLSGNAELLEKINDATIEVDVFKINEGVVGEKEGDTYKLPIGIKSGSRLITLEGLSVGDKQVVIKILLKAKIIGSGIWTGKVEPGENFVEKPVQITVDTRNIVLERQDTEIVLLAQQAAPSFTKDVKPVIAEYCLYACHTTKRVEAGEDVDLNLEVYPFSSTSFKTSEPDRDREIMKSVVASMFYAHIDPFSFDDPEFASVFPPKMPKEFKAEPGQPEFKGDVPLAKIQTIREWYVSCYPNDECSSSGSGVKIEKIILTMQPQGLDGEKSSELVLTADTEKVDTFKSIAEGLALGGSYKITAKVIGESDIILVEQELGVYSIDKEIALNLEMFIEVEDPTLTLSVEINEVE